VEFPKELFYGFGDGTTWSKFLTVLLQSAHRRPDTTNLENVADATDAATAYALAISLKAKFNAHAPATACHFAADSTNKIESADADTVAKLVTLANEIKTDFNAHLEDTGHLKIDTVNGIMADDAEGANDAAKTASAIVLLNEAKAKYNAHLMNAWPM
jgi:hypothetical protein